MPVNSSNFSQSSKITLFEKSSGGFTIYLTRSLVATGCGILAIVFWGILSLLGKLTTESPRFNCCFLWFSISSVILFVKRTWRGQRLNRGPRLSLKQWVIGVGCLFGFHFCFFTALKLAPAIEVTLINYLWPLFLAMMIAAATREASRFIKAAVGSLMGFAGVAVLMSDQLSIIVNSSISSTENLQNVGYLLALMCACIWSGYSMFLSRSPGNSEDMGWLSIAVAVFAFIAHSNLETGYWDLSFAQWIGVLLLGLGPVGGGFYLWDYGLKHGNQALLASFSFTTPMISAIALALFGFNDWSTNIILSLALISSGAIISNMRNARNQ